MFHVVIRARPGTLLVRTHIEARALWARLVGAVLLTTLVVMPNHAHLIVSNLAALQPIIVAMRGYALWRNRWRGEAGPVWAPLDDPTPIRGREHVDRARRYVHLNPCRKGLAPDPLAWPYSTHRDAVGLALPPACRVVPDPEGFHQYVSAAPEVHLVGTSLPQASLQAGERHASLADVFAAVSALTRTSESALRSRGPARDLFIRAARAMTRAPSSAIATVADVDSSTVRHAPTRSDPRFATIARVLDDPRFALLPDGDLRRLPEWRKYRHLR